jgi:thioredoxin reductase
VGVAADERPHPPGDYPVVVVGSGPGGLQTSYYLRRFGIEHAVVSADEGPGGMFRRFPLFERLISWTHPVADVSRDSTAYEAHDQNSLLADEPELRSLVTAQLGESRRRPTRQEMESGLRAFAERAPVDVRYGCRWERTSFDGERYVLTTTDGEYSCRAAVFAIGATEPWVPPIPGLSLEQHYVAVDDARDRYHGARVVIVGKRNSAFEVGESLLRRGVRELTLVSPRPPDLGRLARSPLRPWYLTPLDEHTRGAPGRFVLNASVEAVEQTAEGLQVRVHEPTSLEPLLLPADVVIAATGFAAPLRDLPQLGLATQADGRFPAMSPFWESATLPRVYFAGNVTQAAPGLRKHGVASLSSMVCGFRYNARVLARKIAEDVFGVTVERPPIERAAVARHLVSQLNDAAELSMQKGYLARVVSVGEDGMRDEGTLPLEAFVDGSGDALAVTLEFGPDETIQPVLYIRTAREVREVELPPHPLRRYHVLAYASLVDEALGRFSADADGGRRALPVVRRKVVQQDVGPGSERDDERGASSGPDENRGGQRQHDGAVCAQPEQRVERAGLRQDELVRHLADVVNADPDGPRRDDARRGDDAPFRDVRRDRRHRRRTGGLPPGGCSDRRKKDGAAEGEFHARTMVGLCPQRPH